MFYVDNIGRPNIVKNEYDSSFDSVYYEKESRSDYPAHFYKITIQDGYNGKSIVKVYKYKGHMFFKKVREDKDNNNVVMYKFYFPEYQFDFVEAIKYMKSYMEYFGIDFANTEWHVDYSNIDLKGN